MTDTPATPEPPSPPQQRPDPAPYQYHPFGMPIQYPQAPPMHGPPANGMGASALALGVCGAALAWVPLLGCLGWIACVLAIVFGSIGLASVNSGNATNRRSTIAGLTLGIVGLTLGVTVSIVWSAWDEFESPEQQPGLTAETEPERPGTDSGVSESQQAGEDEPDPPGIGAGTWRVGTEIEPGTYVTDNEGPRSYDSCSVTRLAGFSGEFSDIITWEYVQAGSRGRITIESTDVGVEFSGDCIWTKE